jgi:hypothetical protein
VEKKIQLMKAQRSQLSNELIASVRDAEGNPIEVLDEAIREKFAGIETKIADLDKAIDVAERALAAEKDKAQREIETMPQVNINTGKGAKFDLGKAVRELSSGQPLTGKEAEVAAQRSSEAGQTAGGNGMILNTRDFDMSDGDAVSGVTKHQELSISKFPNLLDRLGVTIIDGLEGDFDIHYAAEHTNAVKVAEKADVTGGLNTPAKKTLSVNRFGWTDIVSKESLAKMNSRLFSSLWADAQKSINRKMEAELFAVVSALTPVTGYVATTNADAAFGRDEMLKFEGLVKEPYGLKYVTNRLIYAAMRGVKVDTGSGKFLVNGNAAEGTTDTGTSIYTTGYGSIDKKVFLADWSECFVGNWGEGGSYEIITNPYTYATKGQVELVINRLSDIKWRNADMMKFASNVDMTA